MILRKENFALNSVSLISIVFALFPISFIAGNLIININFLIFCCLGIYHLRSKILIGKFNFPLKLVLIFFLLVFFSTIFNFVESLYLSEYDENDLSRLGKSILFFRFFIILSIIYFLSEYDIINYKHFFISASIFPILISIDVIFQYIFGFNVIGLQGLDRHNSSFFGDELISGGYIQNFSPFLILFLADQIRKKNNFSNAFLTTLIICTLAIGTLLSGNRMSFCLFLVGLFFLFFFSKNLRKILLVSICIIAFIFAKITSSNEKSLLYNENMHWHYGMFYYNIKDTAIHLPKKIKNNILLMIRGSEESKKSEKWDDIDDPTATDLEGRPYKKIALTAFEIWKKNKLFGNGIKSFRYECHKVIEEQRGRILKNTPQGLCANHPHNYYLEIFVDLGIVGLLLAMGLGLTFIFFLIKNYKELKKGNNLQNLFLLAATISLFLEVFPIKSSGSIFTTNNTTYVILMSAIVLSYKKLLIEKNFR